MANRTDDFNRADGAIGTPSDGGSAWSTGNGTWQVVSNQAAETASGAQATVSLDASSADVEVTATIAVVGSAFGPLGRYADQNNHIVVVIEPSIPRARMYEKISGTFNQRGGTYTGSWSTSDTFSLVLNGSSLDLEQNGTSTGLTGTATTLLSATKHGLRNNGDTTTRYDDFSITDLAGGGGTPVAVFYYHMTQSGGIT